MLKHPDFVWKPAHTHIIAGLVKELNEAPILHHPRYDQEFTLHTDASNVGIGGILSQTSNIVGYYSRKLSEAESRYPVIEKEALAIVSSLIYFKNIVYGANINVYTDHSNLSFIYTNKSQRILRWQILLSEFNIEINYIKGNLNQGADYLSRNLLLRVNAELDREEEQTLEYEPKVVTEHETDEKDTQVIKAWHNELNHAGQNKLYYTLKPILSMGRLKEKVNKVVATCAECQQSKNYKSKGQSTEGKITSKGPFHKIAADIVGLIDNEEVNDVITGNKYYLLTIIDIYTRWSEIIILNDIHAENVTNKFEREWLHRYPRPDKVITDRGTQFMSFQFKKLLKDCEIKHRPTLAYNPTGNAVCERFHREINHGLRIYHEQTIENKISLITNAHRSTYHTGLKKTPTEAVFGMNKFTRKAFTIAPQEDNTSSTQIDEHSIESPQTRAENLIGKQILIKNLNKSRLENPWIGPFPVIEQNDERNMILIETGRNQQWISKRRIKKYREGEQDVMI
eukprot:GAHX01002531.1.p1 GENE.GAHX01002531.1~~GAHX01002531.1.p1  ORF type:complete len:511 (+),score=64.70 GAHX01002531.1:355-1887(+)